jgi:rhodanese-related sulfurtransferase
MLYRKLGLLAMSLAAALLMMTASDTRAEESVPRISSDELKSRLGESGLVILDARQLNEWIDAVQKIAGAQRVDPKDVASWAGNYAKDQVLVVYCT